VVARPLIPKCYIWLKVSWLSTLWVTNPSAEKVITTSHRQVGGSPLRARARPVGAFQSDSWRTAGALKCHFFPSESVEILHESVLCPLCQLTATSSQSLRLAVIELSPWVGQTKCLTLCRVKHKYEAHCTRDDWSRSFSVNIDVQPC